MNAFNRFCHCLEAYVEILSQHRWLYFTAVAWHWVVQAPGDRTSSQWTLLYALLFYLQIVLPYGLRRCDIRWQRVSRLARSYDPDLSVTWTLLLGSPELQEDYRRFSLKQPAVRWSDGCSVAALVLAVLKLLQKHLTLSNPCSASQLVVGIASLGAVVLRACLRPRLSMRHMGLANLAVLVFIWAGPMLQAWAFEDCTLSNFSNPVVVRAPWLAAAMLSLQTYIMYPQDSASALPSIALSTAGAGGYSYISYLSEARRQGAVAEDGVCLLCLLVAAAVSSASAFVSYRLSARSLENFLLTLSHHGDPVAAGGARQTHPRAR